jgi:capsular polysaccharide biosynthesis protein
MQTITDSRLEEYLFERNALNRLTRIPTIGNETIGYVRFDRVWMTAPNFFPVTEDGHAFMHFFGIFATSKYATLYSSETREALIRNAAMFESPDCTTGTFVLGGVHTYYHWLIDFVPRLRCVESSIELRRRPMIVNHQFTSWQQESLAAIYRARGWTLPPLIRMPDAPVVALRDAVVPGRVDRASAVDILRKLYPVEHPPQGARLRLFVGRNNVDYRRLLNQDEVAASLARAKFMVIDPGSMPFADQAALFARADIVVGVHGAALANAVFAPPGSVLVELWAGRQQPHFVDLARLAGLRYAAVEGQTAPGTHERPQHQDFRVDTDRLRAALAAFL